MIEQAKFTYSFLGKAFEKQTKKQIDSLNSVNLSKKTNESRQIEGIFPQNQMNDLILHKLKEIIEFN